MRGHRCSGQESQVCFSDGPAWLISPKPDYSINGRTRKRIQILFWIITVSWSWPCTAIPYGNNIRRYDSAYRDRDNIIAFELWDKRLMVISTSKIARPPWSCQLRLNDPLGSIQQDYSMKETMLDLTPYQAVVLELWNRKEPSQTWRFFEDILETFLRWAWTSANFFEFHD